MLDIHPDTLWDRVDFLTEEEIDALVADLPDNPERGINSLEADIFLAARMADLDFGQLDANERVEAVSALQRLVSHYQAQLYEGVASIYDHLEDDFDGDIAMAHGATAAEIRAQLRLTRRSADLTVDLALALDTRLPALQEAFSKGVVDVARVKTIVNGTEHLSQKAAREIVDHILDDAPNLTTGQLAARLRRLCLEADPDEAAERFDHAVDGRRVELQPDPAGTGHIIANDLDPLRAAEAMARIDRLARSLNVGDETRSMDQLRSDVFLDLLCDAAHPADSDGDSTSTTHVTIDLETLMGLADRSGELAGFGPIVGDLARQAAADSRRWEYSIRDGDTGELISAGTTRRRPTATQQRAVRTTSPTCVFPGCRMPAGNCDLDHIDDFATGGPTAVDNLAPACRHDHNIKHRYGWTYRRLADGRYEWTSRLGLKHSNGPP